MIAVVGLPVLCAFVTGPAGILPAAVFATMNSAIILTGMS